MTMVILSIGILWRLIRYALRFPVWGDEAALALNLMDRDFGAILQPLNYGQVAPALFLSTEMAMQKFAGASEYALRLIPLISGTLATILFWRWSRLLRDEIVVLFAAGFYALGSYTVRHSVGGKRIVTAVVAVFLLIAFAGIGRDLVKPYHGAADQLVRSTIGETVPNSDAPVLVLQPMQAVPSNEQYYLRLAGGRVHWTKVENLPSELTTTNARTLMNFDRSTDPAKPGALEQWRDVLKDWDLREQRKIAARTTPFEPPFWQIITLQPKKSL